MRRIIEAFRGDHRFNVTVVLVDDGSSDGTWEVVRRQVRQGTDKQNPVAVTGVRLPFRYGKARAQAVGLARNVDSDFVVLADADGQHPFEDIPAMVERAARTSEPVIGSRRDYKRGFISDTGVWLLNGMSRLLGVPKYDNLSEFMVLPEPIWKRVASDPRVGAVPVLTLVVDASSSYSKFEFDVSKRHAGEGKWSISDLWQKGVLQLLAAPWSVAPRIVLISLSSLLLLGMLTLLAGVFALALGMSPALLALFVAVFLSGVLSLGLSGATLISVGILLQIANGQGLSSRSFASQLEIFENIEGLD